jgi:prepilin-type N-terminal cleavage/methylation domain-containing protein
MKRAWAKQHSGFSLIEVMVSVIIISTVIAALLQLFANNTHTLGSIEQRVDDATRSTLLLGIGDLGFEKKSTTLDTLVEAFEIDDDLRRRLKSERIELRYRADMQLGDNFMQASEPTDENGELIETAAEDAFVLEIGSTSLTIDEHQTSLMRMRLQ